MKKKKLIDLLHRELIISNNCNIGHRHSHKDDTNEVLQMEVNKFSHDARTTEPVDVFFAYKGTTYDSHEDALTLANIGLVKVVISERKLTDANHSFHNIVVENARRMFSIFCNEYYDRPLDKLKYKVGITGTNGKTTTSFLLGSIFAAAGHNPIVVGTTGFHLLEPIYGINGEYQGYKIKASVDNEITTPSSQQLFSQIDKLIQKGGNCLVCEMSSHALKQQRLFGVKFDACIFTNLTQDHLDYHGSFEDYYQAKKLLFLDYTKRAIINISDSASFRDESPRYGLRLFNELNDEFKGDKERIIVPVYVPETPDVKNIELDDTVKKSHINRLLVAYGNYSYGGISAKLVECKDSKIDFEHKTKFKSHLVGRFNLENIVCAYETGIVLGVNPDTVINGLVHVRKVQGRLDKISTPYASVFVDYAHTPDALSNVLFTLKQLKLDPQSKIITVFGAGGDRDKTKRSGMAAVAERFSDIIMVTSDNPRTEDPHEIIKDIMTGFASKNNVLIEVDRKTAIHKALDLTKQLKNTNNIVLIAGKGHETYHIIGTKKFHFNDAEVVIDYIDELERQEELERDEIEKAKVKEKTKRNKKDEQANDKH